MKRPPLRPAVLLTIASLAGVAGAEEPAAIDAAMSEKVRVAVTESLAEHEVPGMWAAIADARGVFAIGSAGVRRAGDQTPVTDDDLIHLGSCTKAMTTTMLATLVRDGLLTWETTIAESLPDVAEKIHETYRDVTLWELVTHTGGVRANAKQWWAHLGLGLRQRRLRLITDNLRAPATGRGEHRYSNLGYMVAGCMAEAAAGAPWEELMRERLFAPLGMSTAGFGPPGSSENVEQPRGHVWRLWGWTPKYHDNAVALGPAGRVHCGLRDWAKFTALQFGEGDTAVLPRDDLSRLLRPEADDYAGGWIVVERPWAGGTALTHGGSNTMWYAIVWVAPANERAYFAATNSAGQHSHGVLDELIVKLIQIDGREL